MSRVDAMKFEGKEVKRVFLAASLSESRVIEEILTAEEIDFFVEVETFVSGHLTSPAQGAAFYVLAGQAQYCRQRLVDAGLRRGVIGIRACPAHLDLHGNYFVRGAAQP